MKRTPILWLSILLLFGSATVQSSPAQPSQLDEYADELVARANDRVLHETRAWRALLHYKDGGLFNDWESQADGSDFFLAEDGKVAPRLELEATIRAMFASVDVPDEHPQCRFPARYHWLKQELSIDESRLRPVECPELSLWFDTLRPGSLTLVFPAAYINSPSSMFGHTLLRVNPDDHRKDLALVSYALNYAADADASDSALIFSIKGLIGGYPGIFSIVPYYDKIREYSDIENRDVWEYSLDFSHEELQQLMRHAWEVRHIRFDYFFLTENCSYHMLSLMEVARPELDLTDRFGVKAIPSDTVRAVIDADLVTDYHYRPSSTTIIEQRADQLSEQERQATVAITDREITVDSPELLALSEISRARIYEQAYDYSRFLSTADPTVRDPRASINWKLLAARSGIEETDVWQPIIEPEVRSEDGHRTSRLAVGPGRNSDENYLHFRLRPAYHDVLDPPAGYSRGGQINFLDLDLRYYVDREELELERFTILNVLSLSARGDYFEPISWGVDLAIAQHPYVYGRLHAAELTVNGGYSYDVGGVILSALAEVDLRAASAYVDGYSAALGARLDALKQDEDASWQIGFRALDFEAGEPNEHRSLDISYELHLGIDDAVRLNLSRERDYGVYRSDIRINYRHYF